MPTSYTEELPVEITAYRSKIDGSVVVELDQERDPDDDRRIRVYLNDSPIFDGDTDEVSVLDPVEARRLADLLDAVWVNGDLAGAVGQVVTFLRGESNVT
jgi:hypothetical protein